MKILLNFSTLKKGGGQNVALNFLYCFLEIKNHEDNYYFFVAKNSAIHKLLINKGVENFTVLPYNPVKRIIFEVFKSGKVLKKNKIDIIYSYFGFGLFPKHIIQITGSVDSNLYYPEIKFWDGYKGLSLLILKIIDKYRLYGLKRSHAIVFENKDLERRYRLLFNGDKPTITINPSINTKYGDKLIQLSGEFKNYKKGLFLCSWQLNKNVMLIPEIASVFKSNKINFHFVLTAPNDNSILHQNFNSLCNKFGVSDMITVLGTIKKEELSDLYKQIDFVFLLSKLESFSNNIIEAYHFKKPLIISDEPWARSLCGDAAVYVDRNNPEEIFYAVNDLISNSCLYDKYVDLGCEELKKYPSIDEKMNQELKFIKDVFKKYN